MDVVALAQSILDCGERDVLQVLSLAPGLPPVSAETPVAEARRNYMRLAGLVHPDKLQGRFQRSTEVFQKLVRAFELVVDPKYRKQLLSLQAKEAKKKADKKAQTPPQLKAKQLTESAKQITGPKATATVQQFADSSKTKPNRAAPKKKQPTKRKHAPEDDDDFIDYDEDEDEDEDDDEDASVDLDEEDMDLAFADKEPSVSTSRALLGTRRTGGIYRDTTVSCPQCRTPWTPDYKQHYSLFMGPAGKKVHCETCLCRFGCATALHACPHCHRSFDYDASMYDTVIQCDGCRKTFGFPYYPVNQHLIDQVKFDEWRERTEREKAREREERAARRRTTDNNASEEFDALVGECIVNETCPLCKRAVSVRHRQHVEVCLKNKGTDNAASTAMSTAVITQKPTHKNTAVAKKSSTRKPASKPAKKAKKRRRGDDSDSEDE
ncbi:hypothetical protein TraAM80_00348 [Trypanosoma rangeli]|uniref:J domain-containing protein n=1 Tax=Trypanosoma rangeli TaxID=5698 RepID=A0A3R7KYR3_TRYRA|nr:uncharacterized protein TraAM80_00348 [Trypanosoma rangeli]RNF12337.1 hypothetical protein TraAM80_00348 [Trypanosoma rangeli]|eukprot:RNF12337.1 hypothetical protein TraAM80_00348 [Trypanosoma rangeli]